MTPRRSKFPILQPYHPENWVRLGHFSRMGIVFGSSSQARSELRGVNFPPNLMFVLSTRHFTQTDVVPTDMVKQEAAVCETIKLLKKCKIILENDSSYASYDHY